MSDWVVMAFIKILLWITRSDYFACRNCELPTFPTEIQGFLQRGCEDCGSVKLKLIKA